MFYVNSPWFIVTSERLFLEGGGGRRVVSELVLILTPALILTQVRRS